MPGTAVIDWTFEPPNAFEEKTSLVAAHYVFQIDDGRAQCTVAVDGVSAMSALRNEAHQRLDSIFLAATALSHQPYKLNAPVLHVIGEDGQKHFYAFPEALRFGFRTGILDTVLEDVGGGLISDSKRTRINLRNELAATSAAQVADPIVNSILRSYSAAVNDPANELVHLYEIRDALSTHFGGEWQAKQTLNISSTAWSRFGRLGNDEPLRQGRHRGQNPGQLRDAADEELGEARAIARQMIERYLRHLNSP